MLVVIVIILILAGLLLPAIQVARTQAEQARSREAINHMAAAFRAYFVEFQRWPTPSANLTGGGAPAGSTDCLITTDLFANASGITFYDYSVKDVMATQIINSVNYTNVIVDPWKNAYRCRLNTNYTGSVVDPLDNSTVLPMDYAIWSLGPDGTNDLGGETSLLNKDNPRSW